MKQFFHAFLFVLIMAGLASAQVAKQGGSYRPLSTDGYPIYNQVPNEIAYQGLLTTTAGVPVTNGSYSIKFELFNVPSSGSLLWSETQPAVTLTNGTFSVYLGSVNALPPIFYQPLFLQVTAMSGPGISGATVFPRTMFSSSPYALSLRLPYAASSSVPYPGSVLFIGNEGSGVAIEASHDSSGGTAPALLAHTYSTDYFAFGLEGLVTSSSPGSWSSGVAGINNGTGGSGVGVYGYHNGGGYGVYGYTPEGYSVIGESNTGIALYGYSYEGDGLYAASRGYYGIEAFSDSNAAVYATSRTNWGVLGESDSSWGVVAATGNSNSLGLVSFGGLGVLGSGDASVILPDDAIDSYEILDEPGIAASGKNGFYFLGSTGVVYRVDSVVIIVPAPGKVVVQSTGYINFNHTNGTTDNFAFNLDTTTTSPSYDMYLPGVSSFTVNSNVASGSQRQPFSCVRVFNAPIAGTYKFYLLVYEATGDVSSSAVGYPYLLATYYPTVYGSTPVVVTPSTATVGGESDPSLSAGPTAYQTVDQFNTSKRAQMDPEITQLKERVLQLESLMKQQKVVSTAKTQAHANANRQGSKNAPHQVGK